MKLHIPEDPDIVFVRCRDCGFLVQSDKLEHDECKARVGPKGAPEPEPKMRLNGKQLAHPGAYMCSMTGIRPGCLGDYACRCHDKNGITIHHEPNLLAQWE